MTRLPKRTYRIAIVSVIVLLFISFVISLVKKAVKRAKSEENMVVLQNAPDYLLNPAEIQGKKFYDADGGIAYLAEDGNLHYRDKNGREYVITPNGDVFVLNEDGTLSPVSEEERARVLNSVRKNKNPVIDSFFTDADSVKNGIDLLSADSDVIKSVAEDLEAESDKLADMLDILKGVDKDALKNMTDEEIEELAGKIGVPAEVLKLYRDNLLAGTDSFTVADLERALLSEEEAKAKADEDMRKELETLLKEAGITKDIKVQELADRIDRNGGYGKFLTDVFTNGMETALENLGYDVESEKTKGKSKGNSYSDVFGASDKEKGSVDPLDQALIDMMNRDSGAGEIADALSLGNSFAKQNDQSGKTSFIASARNGSKVVSFQKKNDMILKGTVIKATLLNSVNTDLPSECYAVVAENVFDGFTLTNILIPKGSRLCGVVNSSVSWGQTAIQIAWTEVIRPDGAIIRLNGYNSTDTLGNTGTGANVNNHIGSIVGASLVSTLLNYGVSKTSEATNIEVLADALSGTATSVQNIANKFLDKAMERQPTLTLKAGTKIACLANDNISLPIFKRY